MVVECDRERETGTSIIVETKAERHHNTEREWEKLEINPKMMMNMKKKY